MAVDTLTYRQVLGRFVSGVTIVTVAHDGFLSGLTVSAFCSLSLSPPRILICIDKNSVNAPFIRKTGIFAVHILGEDQSELSSHFAQKIADKFVDIPYVIGNLGSPLLTEALGRLECTVETEIDGGDHLIFIGEVQFADYNEAKKPLAYYRGKYGEYVPSSTV